MVHVFMFQNLLFACALTSSLGLASIKEDIKPSYKSDEVLFHLGNKKMVDYDDESMIVTLSTDEIILNYENLASLFGELYHSELDIPFFVYYNAGQASDYSFDFEDYGNYVQWYTNQYGFFVELSTLTYQFSVYKNDVRYDILDIADCMAFTSGDEDTFSFNCDDNLTLYNQVKSAIEADIQANTPSDNMPQVLDDFVGVLTSAIGSLASGIAGGVTAMAQDLFLQDDGEGNITGLSVFGGIVALFAGLALAVGITTKVYTWVTTLGN